MWNKVIEIFTLKVYTNPSYLANLGRVGEIALCQHSRPDVQPDWPAISAVLRSALSLCHVIGTLLGLGCYARVTAPRTNPALHTLELTYQGDPCGQVVKQSSQMKTYYDSFVLCKSNRNTYIIPHTVMQSRYTNVKYHSEISWYFSVHCLPQSLRNYKEEAKIKPSEKALAMPGQLPPSKFSGESMLTN